MLWRKKRVEEMTVVAKSRVGLTIEVVSGKAHLYRGYYIAERDASGRLTVFRVNIHCTRRCLPPMLVDISTYPPGGWGKVEPVPLEVLVNAVTSEGGEDGQQHSDM